MPWHGSTGPHWPDAAALLSSLKSAVAFYRLRVADGEVPRDFLGRYRDTLQAAAPLAQGDNGRLTVPLTSPGKTGLVA